MILGLLHLGGLLVSGPFHTPMCGLTGFWLFCPTIQVEGESASDKYVLGVFHIGWVAANHWLCRYKATQSLFEKHFSEGKELGAQFVVYEEGEVVADFWGTADTVRLILA